MRSVLLILVMAIGACVPAERCRADDTFVLQWIEKQWSRAAKLRERELPIEDRDVIVRWRRTSAPTPAPVPGVSGDKKPGAADPRVVLRRLRLDALAGSPSLIERYQAGAPMPGVDLLLSRGETRVRIEGEQAERLVKWRDPAEPSEEHARAMSLTALELRLLTMPGLEGDADMHPVLVSRSGETYNVRLDDRASGSMLRRVVIRMDQVLREPVVVRAEYPDGLEIMPEAYRRIGERGDGLTVAQRVTIKPRGGPATVMTLDEWTAVKPGQRVDEWLHPASIDLSIALTTPETPEAASPSHESGDAAADGRDASEKGASTATPPAADKADPAKTLEHLKPVSLEDDGGILSLIAVVVVLVCLAVVGISLWRRS